MVEQLKLAWPGAFESVCLRSHANGCCWVEAEAGPSGMVRASACGDVDGVRARE